MILLGEDIMHMIKKLFKHIWSLIDGMTEDNVGTYAAQAAFFVMLSLFPLIMLILSTISFTSISKSTVIYLIVKFLPSSATDIIENIINELYTNSSAAVISVTAIAVIWSASKGMASIITGLSSIYNTDGKWNFILIRVLSIFYTIALVIITVFTLIILVFGNSILKIITANIPILVNTAVLFIILRPILSFAVLTIFFVFIYKIVRNKQYTFKDHLPGAVFASSFWLIFSFAYSYYVDNFANMTYMYGSMTAFIFLMLWIYFCMYSLFIGAELNVYIKSSKTDIIQDN
ncbi:MAG: YihY/virulence factor BrkB family protein [Eubacterium sp.]